jgi:hypothetical protein
MSPPNASCPAATVFHELAPFWSDEGLGRPPRSSDTDLSIYALGDALKGRTMFFIYYLRLAKLDLYPRRVFTAARA